MAQDPYRYFRVEAREFLEELGKGILGMEKGTPVHEVVPRLLRLAHSLKGAARVVRQREIADQAHAIETALAPMKESREPMPRGTADTVLGILDGIGRRVATLGPPSEGAPQGRPASEEALRTVRADIGEMDALLGGVAEAHATVGTLKGDLETLDRARRTATALGARIETLRPGETPWAGSTGPSARARTMAEDLSGTLDSLSRRWALGIDRIDREILQAREAAERLRLVPAGALFTALERSVRDVAQTQGKRVAFEARGGDVRLDAHVLGAIQGALLHVVRNAVAHGIEPSPDREAAGKPPEGRVTLEVARQGRRVVFTCRDDGRGVDLEGVRRAVERKGLPPAEARQLGTDELLRLLLRAGITTSGAVTEVSGRGIGLDVVREAADGLGGEATVRSEAGKGTTVSILVPLSLASLQAILVEASGVTAAIPLDAVRGTLRLLPGDVAGTGQDNSVMYQGKAIPFLPLQRVVRASAPLPRKDRSWSAVVVSGKGGAAAIGVDRLRGLASVVLRPLPALVPPTPTVAGASMEVEEGPRLVLDPDGLVEEAGRASAGTSEQDETRRTVLVIDDSLTTRMLEKSILESAGYEVDIATSGEEAMGKVRGRTYALFLVDVEMPGMDGFDFIERCRADPALRDVPAILVTSRSTEEDRARGKEVGAQGYIAKGEFDQAELLDRIRRLVR